MRDLGSGGGPGAEHTDAMAGNRCHEGYQSRSPWHDPELVAAIRSALHHQRSEATVAAIGTSGTVGACRSAAAGTSDRSISTVSARAAWQP